MPRKRKVPPKEPLLVECKEEQQPEKQKEQQLRDIMNTRNLFGSNIFDRRVISAVEDQLKQSTGSKVTTAPVSKSSPECVTEEPDDCIVLSQGSSSDEKVLRRSPRKRAKQPARFPADDAKPAIPSRETSKILQKLESLERVTCQDIILSDDDSSDSLVCLDKSPVPSLPDEEGDLILMVQCESRMLKYSIAHDKPFAEILEKLAQECRVEMSQVMLLAKEQPVQPEDTPQSLDLSSADILDCIIRKYAGPSGKTANSITLRFQCANKRSTESIEVDPDEPLQTAARTFAKKLGLPLSKLVFKFDGEKVQLKSTPEELSMEDGDCVDVSIQS
uniref:Putative ubiquitin-like protein n=1 Tax=Hyalomma excavatum TaxID=257692 RepID=A0A131XK58_9ACAR